MAGHWESVDPAQAEIGDDLRATTSSGTLRGEYAEHGASGVKLTLEHGWTWLPITGPVWERWVEVDPPTIPTAPLSTFEGTYPLENAAGTFDLVDAGFVVLRDGTLLDIDRVRLVPGTDITSCTLIAEPAPPAPAE